MASATAAISHQSASPLEIFRERAEARATLVANGLMTLQDAVDGLQKSAAAQGLLKQFGQDAIQEIMSPCSVKRAVRIQAKPLPKRSTITRIIPTETRCSTHGIGIEIKLDIIRKHCITSSEISNCTNTTTG